jgi:hypothetical protein
MLKGSEENPKNRKPQERAISISFLKFEAASEREASEVRSKLN